MDYYNYRRTHQGYKLKKNGFRIPASAHLQKILTSQKESSKVKISELIRGRKEAQESLIFAYGSVINEVKNKEVLECQPVTTS
ncbi:MAG: hypothetical protein DDT40_01890 [candidate division WS2 bacterium]|nr:hypothetical protein [Candidatus Psychracetigena formicireducens]